MAEDQPVELLPLENQPLITFALFAYNQEQFIREAVEGAFAQTYEPLEIILSDDCSTDSTFNIMEEMAAAYRGPHAIKLNRNPKNKGISPHVRFIDEMAKGEIIVHAAGDDIAYPERAETLWQAFSEGPDDVFMVISNAMKVSTTGEQIGLLCERARKKIVDRPGNPLKTGLPGTNGCSAAIRKTLINKFPNPNNQIIAEDLVLLRRANLLGCVKYIPEALLKYRIGSGVSALKSGQDELKRFISVREDDLRMIMQFADDAAYIRHPTQSIATRVTRTQQAKLKYMKLFMKNKNIHHLIFALSKMKTREAFRFLRILLSWRMQHLTMIALRK